MWDSTELATAVTADVVLTTYTPDGVACGLSASLSYSPADPFAVRMTFDALPAPVTWTFGRDLLVCGVHTPSGQGDVVVWPGESEAGHPVTVFELRSPDGELAVEAPRSDIAAFARRMLAQVPLGEECHHVDLEAEISAVLHG